MNELPSYEDACQKLRGILDFKRTKERLDQVSKTDTAYLSAFIGLEKHPEFDYQFEREPALLPAIKANLNLRTQRESNEKLELARKGYRLSKWALVVKAVVSPIAIAIKALFK